jgi:hypothetical protein
MKAIIIIYWFIVIYMVMFVCLDLYVIFNPNCITEYGWDNGQIALLCFFAVMASAVLYITITNPPRRR